MTIEELDRNEIKTQADVNIKAHQRMQNRLEYMNGLLKKTETEEDETENENIQNEIENFALCLNVLTEVEIQLSTGGDADGFKIWFNSSKEAVRGVFYWADWGQYAEQPLTEEELNKIIDFFNLTDSLEIWS